MGAGDSPPRKRRPLHYQATTELSHARASLRVLAARGRAPTDELGGVRADLEAFLLAEGAFRTLHDRRTRASLGEHLLGTFDLLRGARCAEELCVAGALHSVYGTNVFTRVTIAPSPERRAQIARAFGARAEHLAHLFHACARPRDLERGELSGRFGPIVYEPRDLADLRLVEAANLLEQGKQLAPRWAAIQAAWEAQARFARAAQSCETRAEGAWPRWAARMPAVLRLASAGRAELLLRLPAERDDWRVRAWADLPPRRGEGQGEGAELLFVLEGEAQHGMPAAELTLLNRFRRCACAGPARARRPAHALRIELLHRAAAGGGAARADAAEAAAEAEATAASALARALGLARRAPTPAGRPPAIPLAELDALSPRALCGLWAALRARGWAVVSLGARRGGAFEARLAEAYGAMRAVHAEGAPRHRVLFDGGRYVGIGADRARLWFNFRRGAPAVSWPGERLPRACDACARVHEQTERAAGAVLRALLHHAGLAALNPPLDELLGARAAALHPAPAEVRFGPSVQRFLLHAHAPRADGAGGAAGGGADGGLGGASGAHADMGLLTLAPRSTAPALELIEPGSGARAQPEASLRAGELLVFAGEGLAWLSGGAVQAPVHRVPWVRGRAGQPPRCAAPFFLRAAPSALLRAGPDGPVLSWRELMERHCVGLRPWRQRAAGAAHCGDW